MIRNHSVCLRLVVILVLLTGAAGWALPSTPAPVRAQPNCSEESEPHDTEADGTVVSGPVCIQGTLPGSDQDIWIWTVSADDAATRWDVSLTGVPNTVSALKFLAV